jgi:hypothetical protein
MMTKTALVLAGCVTAATVGYAHAQAGSTPAPDSNAPANSAVRTANDASSASLARGRNSFTKAEAKGRIEKAGYSDVTGLAKDAMHSGQRVNVALDYKGVVSSR